MKKTESVTEEITHDVTKDILCNICKGSLKDRFDMNYEGFSTSWMGGYGSKIGDMLEFELDICEDCILTHIFPLCKLNPVIDDKIDFENNDAIWENIKNSLKNEKQNERSE